MWNIKSPPFTHSITKNSLQGEGEWPQRQDKGYQIQYLLGHKYCWHAHTNTCVSSDTHVCNMLSAKVCALQYTGNGDKDMTYTLTHNIHAHTYTHAHTHTLTCSLFGSRSEGPRGRDGWRPAQTHASQFAPNLYLPRPSPDLS